ncbi:MAG: hypothetical protein ACYDA5_00355 [Vulcanimicrobiaceae bacterium]
MQLRNFRLAEALLAALFLAGAGIAALGAAPAPVATPLPPSPPSTPVPPSGFPTGTPPPTLSLPSAAPSALPSAARAALPSPTPTPTQPPIDVQPAAADLPVGSSVTLQVQSALGNLTVTAQNPALLTVTINQPAETVTLVGVAPGATALTITDQRGVSAIVPVRVAYNAGTYAENASLQLTGDPAGPEFVKAEAAALARSLAQARPGAQIVAGAGDVSFEHALGQDDVADVPVPVLIQGNGDFSVSGTTMVRVENVAAPRISPDSLMISDFPEKLLHNGLLFTAKLRHEVPTRFLYYHYNPPGQPDRRIVLRVHNYSPEPATLQFIEGRAGPYRNGLEVGHDSTKTFLVRLVHNEGRLIEIPGDGTMNLVEQLLPAGDIVNNLMQLRVLNGGTVNLTLFAQNASSSPDESLANIKLLNGTHRHARGIFAIPELHYAAQWNVTDPYLELPIGQIPLPNLLKGHALAGDYGVLQSFVVNIINPMPTPQHVAIYENPRGGTATGTFLIDGTIVQSHQVPAFSRFKIRQYVIPAKGFVRVTIVTMPESASSYPLRLIFAPDDGSVPPGAPGSPIY